MPGLLAILSDFTLQNVMLGAAILGISSGVLGSFAVLRQQGLLGDTLSHAALPGICLGFLIAGSRQLLPILAGALLSGALAALAMLLLTQRSRLKTDAALGIVLSVFFAIGTVLLTYIQNQNNAGQAGLESFLFGQAAAILPSDLWIMGGIAGLALAVVATLWKEFKVTTFDADFATSLGLPAGLLGAVITVLIALAVVIGLQMVGVVLMAAMIVAPAAAARQWTERLELMVLLAALFGALSGVTGAVLSATGQGLATGPVIVLCATAIVAVSLLLAPNRGLLWAGLELRRHRASLQSRRVLLDLYGLARSHQDPRYASELGMLRAYYGVDSRRVLETLEREGLASPVEHMNEEGAHWRLTEQGYARRNAHRRSGAGDPAVISAFLDNPDAVIVTVGALVGIASTLLGAFLVLRRNSLLTDAISHSIVLGIVVVFLVTGTVDSPFYIAGAALAGVLTVALTELLTRSGRVKNDTAIGLVFPALFGLGVLLASVYASNVHIDVHAVLLGEIAFAWLDTVTLGPYLVPRSLLVMGIVTALNLAFVLLFYKELKLSTFDEGLARALGFRPALLSYALLTLTSVTAVGAFDAVGAILLIAFVIVPPAAAYLLTDKLWRMIAGGAVISVASSLTGYALALTFDVSVGGMMATMTGVMLLLAFVFGPKYGLITQELRRAGQRRANNDRMLVVHLYHHEADAGDGEENLIAALRTHLRWSPGQIRDTVTRVQARGLAEKGPKGQRLYLTPRGRAHAREVLEPWRTREAGEDAADGPYAPA